jgi:hypothetical protein
MEGVCDSNHLGTQAGMYDHLVTLAGIYEEKTGQTFADLNARCPSRTTEIR